MKVKELFKMLEASNKLNTLFNENQKHIEFTHDHSCNTFLTYKNFKQFCKEEFIDSFIKIIEETDLIQNEKYLNYFKGERFEINII